MIPPFHLKFTANLLMMGDNVGLTYRRQEDAEACARILRDLLKSRRCEIADFEQRLTLVRIRLPTGKEAYAHFTAYDAIRAGRRYHWIFVEDRDIDPRSLPNFYTRLGPNCENNIIPRTEAEWEAMSPRGSFE